MTNESILEEAQRLTHGDRAAAYGHPYDDYSRTAALWSVLLGGKLTKPITAHEAALCMIAVKLSREIHTPKRDNMVDAAGYSWVAFKCHERQVELDSLPVKRVSPLPTFAEREAEATTASFYFLPDCPICGDCKHVMVNSNSVLTQLPANEGYHCSYDHPIYHFGKTP